MRLKSNTKPLKTAPHYQRILKPETKHQKLSPATDPRSKSKNPEPEIPKNHMKTDSPASPDPETESEYESITVIHDSCYL